MEARRPSSQLPGWCCGRWWGRSGPAKPPVSKLPCFRTRLGSNAVSMLEGHGIALWPRLFIGNNHRHLWHRLHSILSPRSHEPSRPRPPRLPTPSSRPRLPVLRMSALQEASCNGSLLYAFTVTAVQSPLMQPSLRHRHPSHCSARKTAGCTQRPAADRTQSILYLMNGRSEQTTLLISPPRRQVLHVKNLGSPGESGHGLESWPRKSASW